MKAQRTKDVVAYLTSIGWVYLREARGSHEIWGSPDRAVMVSIPTGHRETSAGVLRQIEKAGVILPDKWH